MRIFIFSILLSIVLTACAPAGTSEPAATPTAIPAPTSVNTPVKFIPPSTGTPLKQLLNLKGSGPLQSSTFKLEAETKIHFNFKTFSDEDILFRIYNVDPNVTDPRVKDLMMALTQHPSEGFTPATLPAGEYQVIIETETGAWEVSVEVVR